MSQSIRTISGESVAITGLALIPIKIGESKYPYYVCAFIVDILAYDVMLGADLLTRYQSAINSDTRELQLSPPTDTPTPTDTPPPCPISNQVGRI
jgi:hypothetical protein